MVTPSMGFCKSLENKKEEVDVVQVKNENHLPPNEGDPNTSTQNKLLNSDFNDDCLYKTNTFEK